MLGVLGFPNDGDVRCLEDNWHCLKLWLVGVGVWCPHHTVFSQIVLQLERVSSFMDFPTKVLARAFCVAFLSPAGDTP